MHLFDINNQPQGSIILNYYGQHLLDTLNFGTQALDSRSSLMLLDHDGYWMKGPIKEKEWGFMFADKKQVSFANEHPGIWRQMQKQKAGQIRTPEGLYSYKILLPLKPNNHTRNWHYDFKDTVFKTQTQLDDYQWVLISFLPASKFYTDTQNALLGSIAYIAVGLVLLAFLAYFLAASYLEKQYLLYKTHHMAFHDELTGLFNRHILDQAQGLNLVLPHDQSTPYAVFFFDLDGFKPINDQYGHHIGDEVLKIVAKRLQSSVREQDILIRLGGDEFALIAPKLSMVKHAERLGQKLLHKIQDPIHVEGHILQLGASIGIALYPKHSDNLDKLISLADDAMYTAKESGKGRVCFPEENQH
uniref:diguanylate cyclase domain-containing protein n=1 Tax=Thiomicrorhabdus sp. TaxID=2039724 RepID=UPI003563948E